MKKKQKTILGHASSGARFEVSRVINFKFKTISSCAEVVYVRKHPTRRMGKNEGEL
jgi:hypothetical protein